MSLQRAATCNGNFNVYGKMLLLKATRVDAVLAGPATHDRATRRRVKVTRARAIFEFRGSVVRCRRLHFLMITGTEITLMATTARGFKCGTCPRCCGSIRRMT